jgi:predicted transcriptional regulator
MTTKDGDIKDSDIQTLGVFLQTPLVVAAIAEWLGTSEETVKFALRRLILRVGLKQMGIGVDNARGCTLETY